MHLFRRQIARMQQAHIKEHLEIPRVGDTWLPGAEARGSSDAPTLPDLAPAVGLQGLEDP